MSFFYKISLLFALVLFQASFSFAADTLEVFAIRVQFAEEKTDNSLTTGNGTFDSDEKKKDSYKLDPPGRRNSVPYWKKHFDFANAYYKAASGGNIVIKSRIFPESSSAYKLKKQIIDYNRTSKRDGEKTAEFDSSRVCDYMQFVYDAVMAAHESSDSPFSIPLSKNPNTKRAFMIIHAGASRLMDGGTMGSNNADTPADFIDAFVSGEYWPFLSDTLANVALKADSSSKKSVVDGLALKGASIDTLRSIMVMSETASQDGLNWGVNGILVNQIGRQLGMPDTYDVVKGISRLGYFDLMDFAGYNAGNGFLPALPAAWERTYMGWSSVQEVRPSAGKKISVDVAAAGSGACSKSKSKNVCTEVLKVPLSASEYLLVENRQRSWNKDGEVSVVLGEPDESSDTTIRTVPVDSLDLVFQDSTCVKGECKVNKKKARGVILDVSSFDAGIPASGIAVWKVNEWFLRRNLEDGVANYWAGDEFRDHQFGLSLIEADGVLSIGKTFKNALGEDTYDYGSGADLLPHLRVADKSSKQKFDTVKTINPTGYANTMTTQGGYTGIRISVSVPEDFRKEKTANGLMGDSVLNFVSTLITVTVSIDDGSIEDSKFPREVGLNGIVRGAVFVDNPEKSGEKIVVFGADNGSLQAFSALGDTLFDADTVVVKKQLTNKGTEKEIPLYRIGSNYGPLLGMASDGKYVYSLHEKHLVRTQFESESYVSETALDVDSVVAGPMVVGNELWYATRHQIRNVKIGDGKFSRGFDVKVTADGNITDMAFCGTDEDGNSKIAYVTDEGEVGFGSKVNSATYESEPAKVHGTEKFYRVSCTDMDRDGVEEAIVLGSRGTVSARKRNGKSVVWTKNYERGAAGSSGLSDETSGMALGDVNGDGYPEIVFLGDNLVYALDRFGLPVSGFPVKISKGSPVYGFFSDPLLVDVTGDDVPEILVPNNDGLIYAYTGKAKRVSGQFPLAAGSFEYVDSLSELQPMSIYVTDAVGSSKSAGPELYAFHRSNVSAFRLQKAAEDAAGNAAAWTLPAGGNERTGYLDASKLKDVKASKSKDEITEFFMFPNPVRGGVAKARFEVGAEANSATIELYDITGLCVFKQKMSDVVAGRNQFENLDLKKLGSDVYTARLRVDFKSGKTKQKLYRVGVIR